VGGLRDSASTQLGALYPIVRALNGGRDAAIEVDPRQTELGEKVEPPSATTRLDGGGTSKRPIQRKTSFRHGRTPQKIAPPDRPASRRKRCIREAVPQRLENATRRQKVRQNTGTGRTTEAM